MSDAMHILEEGGIPANDLPDDVREVLETLSDDEAKALVSVQQKVAAATDEVSGFAYKPTLKTGSGFDGGIKPRSSSVVPEDESLIGGTFF